MNKLLLITLVLLAVLIARTQPQFIEPIYKEYRFTQGTHGGGAFDLKGRDNELIYSPISGRVVENTIDDNNGNTILVIENFEYRARLVHGAWLVNIGKQVRQGQIIGREGNYGLTYITYDNGDKVFCGSASNCGHHTHIILWVKSTNEVVNLSEIW